MNSWQECTRAKADRFPSHQLIGRLRGTSRADHSPEFVSEKKMRPLNGMTLHAIGELGTYPAGSKALKTAISRPCVYRLPISSPETSTMRTPPS